MSLNRTKTGVLFGEKSQPKSPCMVLSSALIQLSDHRNPMSLEMTSVVWQI